MICDRARRAVCIKDPHSRHADGSIGDSIATVTSFGSLFDVILAHQSGEPLQNWTAGEGRRRALKPAHHVRSESPVGGSPHRDVSDSLPSAPAVDMAPQLPNSGRHWFSTCQGMTHSISIGRGGRAVVSIQGTPHSTGTIRTI